MVFQYQADSVVMKEVTVGIQDDEFIEITEGLKENDEIVVAPYQAVANDLEKGTKVQKAYNSHICPK